MLVFLGLYFMTYFRADKKCVYFFVKCEYFDLSIIQK